MQLLLKKAENQMPENFAQPQLTPKRQNQNSTSQQPCRLEDQRALDSDASVSTQDLCSKLF
jgi:hypothetical protein